jgi:hypothetical protein
MDFVIDVEAGLVGQAQIEKNDIGRIVANALNPSRAGGDYLNPVAWSEEGISNLLRDQVGVIIYE